MNHYSVANDNPVILKFMGDVCLWVRIYMTKAGLFPGNKNMVGFI